MDLTLTLSEREIIIKFSMTYLLLQLTNISSRFSTNSKAFAAKFARKYWGHVPQYHIHSDMLRIFKYSTTHAKGYLVECMFPYDE